MRTPVFSLAITTLVLSLVSADTASAYYDDTTYRFENRSPVSLFQYRYEDYATYRTPGYYEFNYSYRPYYSTRVERSPYTYDSIHSRSRAFQRDSFQGSEVIRTPYPLTNRRPHVSEFTTTEPYYGVFYEYNQLRRTRPYSYR